METRPDASLDETKLVRFTPYGEQAQTLVGNPIRSGPGYTGLATDAATGLSYMQQRYYDPTLGRFLTPDPVGVSNKAGGNFNRYWYGNNNPYGFTDPDGRWGRGMGWSNTQWDRFKNAQDSAATAFEQTAARMSAAIAAGGDALKQETERFEQHFGAGSATNMEAVAKRYVAMAGALRDQTNKVHLTTRKTASRDDFHGNPISPYTLGYVPPGTQTLKVIQNSENYSSDKAMSEMLRHEPAHAALGLTDYVGGIQAYNNATKSQGNAFDNMAPADRVKNPEYLRLYLEK
jgi:RHS repeat-associated protein